MYINYHELSFLIFLSYLIGSIPFGLIFSTILKKNDPRLSGSKNIGATNIARISGWKLGLLILLLDISKGFLVVNFFIKLNYDFYYLSIFFVCMGHMFPFWLNFKGGKGVAVLIGSLFAYQQIFGFIFIVSWLTVAFTSKYSSLSALISCFLIIIILIFRNDENLITLSLIILTIILKHIPNIKRLINGKETKINFKSKN